MQHRALSTDAVSCKFKEDNVKCVWEFEDYVRNVLHLELRQLSPLNIRRWHPFLDKVIETV